MDQAIEVPGGAVRTIFSQYLSSPALRTEIHEGLQVVENRTSVNTESCSGKDGQLTGPEREPSKSSALALCLRLTAVAYVNTIIVQPVLADPACAPRFTRADQRGLSALFFWTHLNLYGRLLLDMDQPPRRADARAMTGPNGGRRRRALLVGAAVGLVAAAGAVAALGNFVTLPLAAGLGAVSGAAGFTGPLLWERHAARQELVEAWARVVDAGPAVDELSESDSLLASLNPDRRTVGFNRRREHDLRLMTAWCTSPAAGGAVWLLSGDAGEGKTRLLIEAAGRLMADGWVCGWVRRGQEACVVDVAGRWDKPVLLIADDAETRRDLAALITAAVRLVGGRVRVVVAAREFGDWWIRLRAGLDPDVSSVVAAAPRELGRLATSAHGQRQLFTQAVRAFAQARHAAPPAAVLVAPAVPAPLVLIHAAAAVTVAHNLTGQIDIDTALHQLFATEEAWWQRRAAADSPELHALGLPALQAAIVLAVLLGAGGLDDAVRRLRFLPGLGSAGTDRLQRLALWLRELYPQQTRDWLAPHLPARVVERYVATHLATHLPLVAAIATAALPPPGGTP